MKNRIYHRLFLVILLTIIQISAIAQNGFGNHWHFGNGIGIDFNTGTPVLEPSNIDAPAMVEAGTLSDISGNLLLYTDGISVYNSSGSVVDNGVFDTSARESIFCPFPGFPSKYYLFRSIESNGVTWSIIDLNTNAGLGGIDDTEKEINLHPEFAELMITSNANQTDFWLVTANNTGNDILEFTSFSINNTGVIESSSFSNVFIFATWYANIDDARMSPTCTKIVTIHKGHYATLFNFDNNTGEVTSGFSNSGDVISSFVTNDYCDFTDSGDYLYILKDNIEIWRHDATTFNFNTFVISGELIASGDWNHIKRGPDGNMYFINSNGFLDKITDPDGSPILSENILDLNGSASIFFPNTMNSCSITPYILVSDVCIGDSTTFLSSLPIEPDSLFWTIDGVGINDTVYSISYFTEYYNEPNELNVTFNYYYDSSWYEIDQTSYIFAQPSVTLPEDILACDGDIVEVSVSETPYTILWSTQETTPSIDIEYPGTYSVVVENGLCFASDEIVIDFLHEPYADLDDLVICDEIIEVTLDATNVNTDEYLWSTEEETSSISVSTSGLYSVTLSNDCFTIIEDVTVTYVLFPESLVESHYTLCESDTLHLTSNYVFGDIAWNNGDIGPNASFYEEGSYFVTIDHLGCFSQDLFEVETIPYVDVNTLIAPNIITTNNDGTNDVFRLFDNTRPEVDFCNYVTLSVDLTVYNRWGNILHEGGCLWDGSSSSGNTMNEATYYYLISARSECGEHSSTNELEGTIQILR